MRRLEAERRRGPAARTGMTLLEVLAAVAVLGLLYTVLAGVAMQGLRAEGESQRLLEASLLADRVLAELEQGLAVGDVPPLGTTESEQDGFRLEVAVSPLELSLPEPTAEAAKGSDSSQSFLGPARRGVIPPLRRIDLRVTWAEGQYERDVWRTSFAFDAEAVRSVLDELGLTSEEAGVPSEEPVE